MKVRNATAFVTGAAGGIGQQICRALEARGAKKIYGADIPGANLQSLGPNVEHVSLDVTDEAAVARAAKQAADVDLLINSAGVFGLSGLIAAPNLAAARREMDVNYWGGLILCRAFAPVLGANGGGAIVNVLSEAARVCVPFAGSYCASKSAAWIMTQGVRAELAAQGTQVMAAFPATTDTQMVATLDMDDKLDPAFVAGALLDALEQEVEDISIGEHALYMERLMFSDYKALEKESAAIMPGATAVADMAT
ncbi:MAG: SDR family NAD(P)-dependent oxidoreductase [Alphaproteobacteria bacterium]